MRCSYSVALSLVLTIYGTVYGQLTVNTTQTAQQLIQDEFVSGNSNVTNVTVTGSNNPRSYGRFDRPAAGTPQEVFQRGIILSTGRAVDLPGPNIDDNTLGNVSASTSLGTAGNTTLNLYSGQTTYDATVISFQFVPTSNVVRFRYIFASEEYTEYVNAGFNDVFAFLITGPGIVGEAGLPPNTRNIARLPNGQPVSINTVNHLINTSCFRDNVAGFMGLIPGPYNIEYDGFTCILTAESPVIPCSTYTLQLMIADAGDNIYDSAVLLEANSFEFAGDTSSVASLLNLFNGQPVTYESCDNDIRFTIRRSSTVANGATQNDTVFFEHIGTATYLQDYTLVPPYAVFAPGQTEVFVDLIPIYDGIDEPDETVIIRFVAPGTCGQVRQLQAVIRNANYNLLVNPPNDTTICAPPGTVNLNLTAGIVSGPPGMTYQWTNLANGQILSTNNSYAFPVTQNVSIEVRIMANMCNIPDVRDTIHVTVLTPDPNNPLTVTLPDIPPVCGGNPITLSPIVTGGVGVGYDVNYYQNGVLIGTGVPFTFSPTVSGNLLIETVDECGYAASVFRSFVVESGSMVASDDAVICTGQSAVLTVGVQNGALGNGYVYNWREVGTNAFVGGGPSITVSPAATTRYYVSSPDFPCGNDTVLVTVIESTQIEPIPPQTICPGQSATFTANATGQGNIVYTWTPPAGPPFVGNPYTPNIGVSTVFTVTAHGDCGVAQTTATLNVLPNDLSADLVADPSAGAVCAGIPVSLSVLPSGGNPPYSYQWQGATGNGPNLNVQPAGPTLVSVNITDACTTITRSIYLDAHPPLFVDDVQDVSICQGQAVTLSANVSGGSGNYVIQWRRVTGNVNVGTGNPLTFTPTHAGQYSLRVTDVDCGSQEVRTFNIVFAPPFTLDPIADQTVCSGQTATFNAVASSTSGTVTYAWTQLPGNTPVGSNSPTLNISPTATTQYRLTVTDACTTRTRDFTANVLPDNLDFTLVANPGTAVCAGAPVTFSANITGGTGNYQYFWTYGAQTGTGTTFTATVSGAGQVSLQLSDDCRLLTRTLNVSVEPPVSLTPPPATTICFGNSTTLTANGSGGLPPLNYQWTGPDNFSQSGASVTVSPATDAVYTVTLTDACGTVLSQTVFVAVHPDLTLAQQTGHTICQGQTVDLTAVYSGGVSPVVEWFELPNTAVPFSNSASVSLSPATSTNYRLVVRDACFTRQSDFTVQVIPPTLSALPLSVLPANTVCVGQTVTLSTNTSGGSGNYIWNWSPPAPSASSATFVVNQAGTYSVTVSDGCNTVTRSVNIDVAPPLNLTASDAMTICAGQSVSLSANGSGGLPPLDYQWAGPDNFAQSGASVTVSPAADAVYTVTLTDACGTVLSQTVSVAVQPDLILAQQTGHTVCQGQTVDLTAVYLGGVNPVVEWFELPNTAVPFSNSASVSLSPATTTNYRLVVRDACFIRQSDFTVNVVPGNLSLSSLVAQPSATVCSGTTVTLSADVSGGSGNYTYTWTPAGPNASTTQFDVHQSGTYSLTVSDGCNTVTRSVEINLSPPLTLNASGTATICPGQSAPLTATATGAFAPGTLPAWRDAAGNIVGFGNVVVAPSASAVYTATIADTCGNALTETVAVTVRPDIFLASLDDRAICPGESTTYTAVASGSGTLSYSWTGSSGYVGPNAATVVLSPSASETYTLTVTDECSSRSTVFAVNVHPATLAITNFTAPAAVCVGTQVNLNPTVSGGTGNYVYSWSPPAPAVSSASFVILSPTTISLTVSDGCRTVSQSLVVEVNPALSISVSPDTSICPVTGAATLSANVQNVFGTQGEVRWFSLPGDALVGTGATIGVAPASATTYYATVSDDCGSVQSSTVTVNVFPSATLEPIDDVTICQGETVQLSAVASGTGTLQYRWSNVVTGAPAGFSPDVSLSPSVTTDYQIQVTDDCTTLFDPFRINVVPADLTIQPFAVPGAVCQGTTVSVSAVVTGGSQTYSYAWNPPAPDAPVADIFVASPTTVSLTVSDGCMSVAQSVFIDVNTPPQVSAYGDANLCVGFSTTIGANVTGGLGTITGLVWTDATGAQIGVGNTITVSPSQSTYYVARATDECGVTARDTVRITVFDSAAVGNLPDTTICFGESVFYAVQISGTATVRWVELPGGWEVGSGLTVLLSPLETTTYRLEAEDSCFVLTRFFTITVHPADLGIFQNPPSTGPVVCSGTTVTLSVFALGGTGNYTYIWSDGQTGSTINHVVSGDETIRVWVYDGCRRDSTAFDFVTDPPVYATAAGSINLCEGSQTQISVSYGGGIPPFGTPVWTLDDGTLVGQGDTLTVAPTQTTRYFVNVSDVCGATARDSVTISVFGPFGVGDLNDRTICFGESTTYTAQIAGTGDVLWERETSGGYVWESDQLSVTLSPPVTANYRLTVSDSCFVVVRNFSVNVVALDLSVVLTASLPSPVCSGTVVEFYAEATGGSGDYAYQWSDGSTASSGGAVVYGPTVVFVTVTDGCQTVSDTLRYDVVAPMTLSTSGHVTICLNASTTLQAYATGGLGNLQYSWTTGGVEVGTNASLLVAPEQTTVYLVTVTDECDATATEQITVTVLSPFGVGDLGDRTICFGDSTTYTAQIAGTGDVLWERETSGGYVWESDQLSVTLSPPVTANYRLTVSDSCFVVVRNFTVNVVPGTLGIDSLVMNPPPPVCVGTPVTLTAYVSGGSGQYVYEWSQDNTGLAVLSTVVAGAGSVTVRVSDGCQTVVASQAFSDNPDLSIDAGPDLTICTGQTANLFVTFTGGFGNPDDFQWVDLSTGTVVSTGPVASVSPASSRSYRVILADECGTSAADTVSVFLFEPLFVAPPMDTIVCGGACVEYSAWADGTGTTTFEWLDFTAGQSVGTEGTVTLCPTSSTIYLLTVRDTCGEAEYLFNVYVLPVDLSVEIVAEPGAFVCADETVVLTAWGSGGTGDYVYQWQDGWTGAVRPYVVSAPGTMWVRVWDGCSSATDTVELGVAPGVAVDAGADLGICLGATAQFHATATSGFGAYAFEWYVEGEEVAFAHTADVSVSPAADTRYVLRVSDECGSVGYDTVRVRVLEALVVEPLPDDTTICFGESVTYTIVSGGVGNIEYFWYADGAAQPFAAGQTVTLAPAQSTHYVVTVADSCAVDSLDFYVQVIPANLSWQIQIHPAVDVCPGTQVTINATASGGSGHYVWTGANAGTITTTVGSTVQTLVFSVADGCTALDTAITLTPFGPPSAYAGADGYVCAGEPWTLYGSVSGGSGNYGQVRWMDLSGAILFEGYSFTFVPLASESYVFALADDCGLEARDTVYVEVRPVPVVDAGAGVEVCQGTPVPLNGTPVAGQSCTYLWSPAVGLSNPGILNPVAMPDVTTLYSLVAICDGCTSLADTVRVIVHPAPVAGTDADTVWYCLDGVGVELPGYVYSGTPPITVQWQPSVGLDNPNSIRPFASPEAPTTYTLSAVDSKGCVSNTITVTVKHIPLPMADAGEDRTVCVGDPPFHLSGSGTGGDAFAYSYRWEPAVGLSNPNVRNPLVFPDSTRTYTLYVASQPFGCRSRNVDETSTVTVWVKTPPTADAGPDRFTCEGQAVQLAGSASGGNGTYEYRWTPAVGLSDSSVANPTAAPPHTFTYMLQVISDGCVSATDVVTVYVGGSPTVVLPNVYEICPGESVDLNALVTGAQQPYTYTWEPPLYLDNPSGGTTIATPAESITYTLYVASNGCPGIQSDSVRIVLLPGVWADADTTDRGLTICRGESVRLPAAAGGPEPLHWSWRPAPGLEDVGALNPVVAPQVTAVYTLEAWRGSCRAIDSVRVTVVEQTSVRISASADGLCTGETVVLTAHADPAGALKPHVVWRNGEVEIGYEWTQEVNLPGVYTVRVDWNGECYGTDTVSVNFIAGPTADFLHSHPGGCDALEVSFEDKSANAAAWVWDFGDGSPVVNERHPRHYYAAPGKYRVTLTANGVRGCSAKKTAEVDVRVGAQLYPAVYSDPPAGTVLHLTDATVNFFDSTRHVMARNWHFGDGYHSPYPHPTHRFLLPGTYTVKITLMDSSGCTYERQLGPYVVLPPELEIPNVFTPNGDGRNDYFRPNYQGVEKFVYSVYDRWGNVMYMGDELSTGWNGTDLTGRPATEGVYLYVLTFDERRVYNGTVTLLR